MCHNYKSLHFLFSKLLPFLLTTSSVQPWDTSMPGGLKISFNGQIYSFTTDVCSGGVFFKRPVPLDFVCAHGYFFRRPNGCVMAGQDIIAGRNFVCINSSQSLEGSNANENLVQAFIPLTTPELPLEHTIGFYDDADTLKNFRRYSFLKGFHRMYDSNDIGSPGIVVSNTHNTPEINIGKLCYQGIPGTGGAAFIANISLDFSGESGGFFTRPCNKSSVYFPWRKTLRYDFLDGYTDPKTFDMEIEAIPADEEYTTTPLVPQVTTETAITTLNPVEKSTEIYLDLQSDDEEMEQLLQIQSEEKSSGTPSTTEDYKSEGPSEESTTAAILISSTTSDSVNLHDTFNLEDLYEEHQQSSVFNVSDEEDGFQGKQQIIDPANIEELYPDNGDSDSRFIQKVIHQIFDNRDEDLRNVEEDRRNDSGVSEDGRTDSEKDFEQVALIDFDNESTTTESTTTASTTTTTETTTTEQVQTTVPITTPIEVPTTSEAISLEVLTTMTTTISTTTEEPVTTPLGCPIIDSGSDEVIQPPSQTDSPPLKIDEIYRHSPIQLKFKPIINPELTHWDPYIEESVYLAKSLIQKDLEPEVWDTPVEFQRARTKWFEILENMLPITKALAPKNLVPDGFLDTIVNFFGYVFRTVPDDPEILDKYLFENTLNVLSKCGKKTKRLFAHVIGCPAKFNKLDVQLKDGSKSHLKLQKLPPKLSAFNSHRNDVMVDAVWSLVDIALCSCYSEFLPDSPNEYYRLYFYMKQIFLNERVQKRWFIAFKGINAYAGLLPFGDYKTLMFNLDKVKAAAHTQCPGAEWHPKPEIVVADYSHRNIFKVRAKAEGLFGKRDKLFNSNKAGDNPDPFVIGNEEVQYFRPFQSRANVKMRANSRAKRESVADDVIRLEFPSQDSSTSDEAISKELANEKSSSKIIPENTNIYAEKNSHPVKSTHVASNRAGFKPEQLEIWNGMAYCLQANYEDLQNGKVKMRGITPSLESLQEFCDEKTITQELMHQRPYPDPYENGRRKIRRL